MTLEISKLQLQAIERHAEAGYPAECCGILIGKISGDSKIVVETIATVNAWEESAVATDRHRTKNSRYRIEPREIFQAQKCARELHLEIIGFFHSHPDAPAIPSECDRECAWEIYSYPIVSVVRGKVNEIASWVLDNDRTFQPEVVHLVDRDPID